MIRTVIFVVVSLMVGCSAAADSFDAVCRITYSDNAASKSYGSGAVFCETTEALWILTNKHVVGDRKVVAVEFWCDGHLSLPLQGTVIWESFSSGRRDLAVVAVDGRAFAGTARPRPIPLAPRNTPPPTVGQEIRTTGCALGAWSTSYAGHATRTHGSVIEFLPPPADGRSGSPLLSADGQQIIGVVTWRSDDERGIAQSIAEVYSAFDGQAPAHHNVQLGMTAISTLSAGLVPILRETAWETLQCTSPYCKPPIYAPPQPILPSRRQPPVVVQPTQQPAFPTLPATQPAAPPATQPAVPPGYTPAPASGLPLPAPPASNQSPQADATDPLAQIRQIYDRMQNTMTGMQTDIGKLKTDVAGIKTQLATVKTTQIEQNKTIESATTTIKETERSVLERMGSAYASERESGGGIKDAAGSAADAVSWYSLGTALAAMLGLGGPIGIGIGTGFWILGRRLKRRLGDDDEVEETEIHEPGKQGVPTQQPPFGSSAGSDVCEAKVVAEPIRRAIDKLTKDVAALKAAGPGDVYESTRVQELEEVIKTLNERLKKAEASPGREYVPIEVETRRLRAVERALKEFARRHPESVGAIDTIEAYARQFESGDN